MKNSGNAPASDRYTGDVKMNGQRNGKGYSKCVFFHDSFSY